MYEEISTVGSIFFGVTLTMFVPACNETLLNQGFNMEAQLSDDGIFSLDDNVGILSLDEVVKDRKPSGIFKGPSLVTLESDDFQQFIVKR